MEKSRGLIYGLGGALFSLLFGVPVIAWGLTHLQLSDVLLGVASIGYGLVLSLLVSRINDGGGTDASARRRPYPALHAHTGSRDFPHH